MLHTKLNPSFCNNGKQNPVLQCLAFDNYYDYKVASSNASNTGPVTARGHLPRSKAERKANKRLL